MSLEIIVTNRNGEPIMNESNELAVPSMYAQYLRSANDGKFK